MKLNSINSRFGLAVVSAVLAAATHPALAQQRFASSDDAVKALTTATENKDTNAFHEIFGPALQGLISPDPVQASNGLSVFSRRLAQKIEPVKRTDDKIELDLGADAWPFPIPLVKQDGQWFFDTAAGAEEIVNRRVGRNELGAISVCHAYVEAQHDYASKDRIGDGVPAYALRLRSTPGAHDGLYWHPEPGKDVSPLGPLIAQACDEGYTGKAKIMGEEQNPYHGYFYKIATSQGPHAAGGEYSYIINGRMIAGFALVSWPAEWGNSGVMTFIVNQQGKVYEKNLGPDTDSLARAMTTYDPDSDWKPAEK
jgi:hypothetical protein